MRKILLFSLMLLPSICFAETWYTMTEKDYIKFCDDTDFYSDIDDMKSLYRDGGMKLTDKDIVLGIPEVMANIKKSLVKVSSDSDALRRYKFEKAAKYASEHWKEADEMLDNLKILSGDKQKEMSTDDKLSILGGKITLLENEILILKDQLKGFRGIK